MLSCLVGIIDDVERNPEFPTTFSLSLRNPQSVFLINGAKV
jgi:hypothetical protein